MIYYPWFALALVWLVGAMAGKKNTRREAPGEQAAHLIPTAIGFNLVLWGTMRHFGPQQQIGFALTIAGVLFAIWARLLLGTNWSGVVTLKEGHELLQRGPYSIVRHPIYTGMLSAMLGTAIYFGNWRCFAGVALTFLTFWKKSRVEEGFMLDYFGDRYRTYQTQVKALIPRLL